MAYAVEETGLCPHCRTTVRFENAPSVNGPVTRMGRGSHRAVTEFFHQGPDVIRLGYSSCPSCLGLVITVCEEDQEPRLLWPSSVKRNALHSSVPSELAKDFAEAVTVLPFSANASAALARRCLQTLLVRLGAKKSNLVEQIDEMYDSFPTYVQSAIDKVRDLGNLAVHAKEDKATAEIVDVEPGEAEWLLGLLEELFDHCYAKPAATQGRIAEIEAKLDRVQRIRR